MTDTIITVEPGPVSVVTVAGEKGISGKSAYQVAVDNGFVGTEAEWLASIDGAAAITAHVAASDPHPQYLTSAEGDSAYDAAGTASTAVAAHASGVGVHNISGVASLQTALDSKIANVVEDATPQFGGDIDVNGHKIVSVSNGNIEVKPNGTGDFFVNTNQFYIDTSTGFVGIGKSNPETPLDVNGNITFGSRLITSTDGQRDTYIAMAAGSASLTVNGASLLNITTANIYFNVLNLDCDFHVGTVVSDDSLFVEGSSGNVGIGITAPDTKLDVNGAITLREQSSIPGDPDNGSCVLWMESATGDIKMKITSGGVTKTVTLVDFSAI